MICLQQLPRFLQAIVLRLDKLARNPARDLQLYRELQPLLQHVDSSAGEAIARAAVSIDQDPRWLIEELRVSLFAQELGTRTPVSMKKLRTNLGV